ncbi:type 1 glutamine amidotransferase domain-containing protein [Francisella hispaniensis]|uniref:Type 1 glutamine amidotransferase domain-containing protein n=1 Tax=Francisella hispaniensis FSC454 TaxID=1088883 RepID=A0AAC9J8K4_9GAMM|nr:type 1 glutamine amidotransferase domain-containing protein [Francisella hispaniensis]APD51291.1 type 1 glutamine amidotransferase domain-containing protein [Francisella hispaniensis FSC454]KYW82771.1 thiamine biosynthesis protein ThiJ [Francisella hispaniensis FSC454]
MVTTSHNRMGDSNEKTGLWLSELTHPYYRILDDNINIDIVSIMGGEIPIDPNSVAQEDYYNDKFLADDNLKDIMKNSTSLRDVNIKEYDAIVFAGGHGTMWDFPNNSNIHSKVLDIYARNGVIGAICHGVAALINVKDHNGQNIIKDKEVTGFSNNEEKIVGLTDVVPFSLEDSLVEAGAKYSSASEWQSYIKSYSKIITAQNPQSANDFAKAIKQSLFN